LKFGFYDQDTRTTNLTVCREFEKAFIFIANPFVLCSDQWYKTRALSIDSPKAQFNAQP
jgi:hypothetical protein